MNTLLLILLSISTFCNLTNAAGGRHGALNRLRRWTRRRAREPPFEDPTTRFGEDPWEVNMMHADRTDVEQVESDSEFEDAIDGSWDLDSEEDPAEDLAPARPLHLGFVHPRDRAPAPPAPPSRFRRFLNRNNVSEEAEDEAEADPDQPYDQTYIDGGGYHVVENAEDVDEWFVNASPVDLTTVTGIEDERIEMTAKWIGDCYWKVTDKQAIKKLKKSGFKHRLVDGVLVDPKYVKCEDGSGVEIKDKAMAAALQDLHKAQYPNRYEEPAEEKAEEEEGEAEEPAAPLTAAEALRRHQEAREEDEIVIEKHIGDKVTGATTEEGLEVPSAVWSTEVPGHIDVFLEEMAGLMWQAGIDPPMKLVITQRTLEKQSAESHAFNQRFRNFYTGADGDQYTGPVRHIRSSYPLLTTTVLAYKKPNWLQFLAHVRATLPEALAALPAVAVGAVPDSEKLTVSSGNVEEIKATVAVIDTLKAEQSSDAHECAICQCEFEKDDTLHKIVGCGHHYCKECLDQWAEVGNKCPKCNFVPTADNTN